MGENVEKKIEAIAYTKDKIYYITEAIDLAIIGYEENEIELNERAMLEKQIQNNIEKLDDMLFNEKMQLLILQNSQQIVV